MGARLYLDATEAQQMMRAGNRDGLAEYLNLQPGETVEDSTLLQRCLEDANSMVDVYIKSVCTLPLLEVPPMLRRVCLTILKYNIVADARPETLSPQLETQYQDAVGILKDIASKKIELEFPQTNVKERLTTISVVDVGIQDSSANQTTFRNVLSAY